ncbi:type II secretion system protein GspI [Idiomarina tyrosinivorans]|uniref:Type II secretion system protein I n=2 Tax=Idiomarina tyrosinivorans TaxID=1445662 RepID=A0A432ZR47_9GAMM|nr:type II secretion system protein GspI [Idiomarina tyrosinivorans]
MRRNGFTLIEVMVALAVFGVAALAALQAASSHLSNQGYLQQKVFARWVAANQLAELSLGAEWPLKDNKQGKVEQAGTEWYWRQKVVGTATPNVVAVTVSVATKADGNPVYQLTRYLGKPQ